MWAGVQLLAQFGSTLQYAMGSQSATHSYPCMRTYIRISQSLWGPAVVRCLQQSSCQWPGALRAGASCTTSLGVHTAEHTQLQRLRHSKAPAPLSLLPPAAASLCPGDCWLARPGGVSGKQRAHMLMVCHTARQPDPFDWQPPVAATGPRCMSD